MEDFSSGRPRYRGRRISFRPVALRLRLSADLPLSHYEQSVCGQRLGVKHHDMAICNVPMPVTPGSDSSEAILAGGSRREHQANAECLPVASSLRPASMSVMSAADNGCAIK